MNDINLILKKQALVDIAEAIREKADVNGLIKIDNLDEAIRALSANDDSIMNYIDVTQTTVKDASGNWVLRKQTLINIADAIREQSGTKDLIAIGDLDDAVRMIGGNKVLPYLTFSSPSTFTLNIVNNKKYWDGTLEYSTDASVWSEWDGTSAVSSSTDGKLYMRGIGNTYITGSSAGAYKGNWVFTGNDISCSGNIETLLDYQTVVNGEHPIMADYCYRHMFYNCTNLTNAPSLPATTLTSTCYNQMFFGCTSLTNAPALPATTLADYCYTNMFYNCTNLTNAPSLPATTLADSCYQSMFFGCTQLTSIPALPATTLADYCYTNMFYNCTNIKLSTTQVDDYQTEYRIPTSGTGTTTSNALTSMFNYTGGTFKSTPSINTTYYTSNEVI